MDTPMVFERYEIKYLLNGAQKQKIMEALEGRMEPDRFGRSTIRNIYYDTDTFRLARRSLEHPVYKEKLRVRSYQKAAPQDQVFIELKKKYNSVVYKRRMGIRQTEAEDYLAGRIPAPARSQITDEIDYFVSFYGTLQPKIFLSYEREAFFDKKEESFRRACGLSLGEGAAGEPLLEEGSTLMELKTCGGIPLWMVEILTKERLQKVSFSKYGNAYCSLMERERGGKRYA